MKKIILVSLLTILAGCSSLNMAGTSHYSIKPFHDAGGKLACCVIDIKSGKPVKEVAASVTMGKAGIMYINLIEKGVQSVDSQKVAAGVASEAIKAARPGFGGFGGMAK